VQLANIEIIPIAPPFIYVIFRLIAVILTIVVIH